MTVPLTETTATLSKVQASKAIKLSREGLIAGTGVLRPLPSGSCSSTCGLDTLSIHPICSVRHFSKVEADLCHQRLSNSL
jgi:hypothetical protein